MRKTGLGQVASHLPWLFEAQSLGAAPDSERTRNYPKGLAVTVAEWAKGYQAIEFPSTPDLAKRIVPQGNSCAQQGT